MHLTMQYPGEFHQAHGPLEQHKISRVSILAGTFSNIWELYRTHTAFLHPWAFKLHKWSCRKPLTSCVELSDPQLLISTGAARFYPKQTHLVISNTELSLICAFLYCDVKIISQKVHVTLLWLSRAGPLQSPVRKCVTERALRLFDVMFNP